MPERVPESGGTPTAEPKPSRILVVEDHLFVRRAIMALINHQADLVCCGEAETVSGTAALVAELGPDLVLLDLHLADGDSFQLIERLKESFPRLPVLMFSESAEAGDVVRALRCGARGYLLKQDATEMLVNAIRNLLAGRYYVSRSLAHLLFAEIPPAEPQARPAQQRPTKRRPPGSREH